MVAVWLRDGEAVIVDEWCVVLVAPLRVWTIMVEVVSVAVEEPLSVLVDVLFVIEVLILLEWEVEIEVDFVEEDDEVSDFIAAVDNASFEDFKLVAVLGTEENSDVLVEDGLVVEELDVLDE